MLKIKKLLTKAFCSRKLTINRFNQCVKTFNQWLHNFLIAIQIKQTNLTCAVGQLLSNSSYFKN